MLPQCIVHCDWSRAGSKRWAAIASLDSSRCYRVQRIQPAGPPETLFERLPAESPGPLLVGFDFPIGLPQAYAARACIKSFRAELPQFGEGRWVRFYEQAERAAEISLERPFYPRRPGGARRDHLWRGLGLASPSELLRVCEHPTRARNSACALFWTLGPNQAGPAAIAGWRDLLAPALGSRRISLWPFDGELPDLLRCARIVIAETYPAEIYGHLGMPRGFGKRSPEGRRAQADTILHWCARNRVAIDADVQDDIRGGFGTAQTAEDRFDAVVGLLGLVGAVMGLIPCSTPSDPVIRDIEGWILGVAG